MCISTSACSGLQIYLGLLGRPALATLEAQRSPSDEGVVAHACDIGFYGVVQCRTTAVSNASL